MKYTFDAKKFYEDAKRDGISDQAYLNTVYDLFVHGQIDENTFEIFVNAAGYELTDEFKKCGNVDDKRKFGLTEESKKDYDKKHWR
jgi:hypothetical protein